jgi:hypothetical protein
LKVVNVARKHPARFWGLVGGAAVLVALALAIVVINAAGNGTAATSANRSGDPSASHPQMTQSGPEVSAPPANSLAPSAGPTGDPGAPENNAGKPGTGLALADNINRKDCGNFGWDSGPARIGGTNYESSIFAVCYFNKSVVSVDFAVPAQVKTLTGVAGIDDRTTNKDAKVAFTFIDDQGKPIVPSQTVAYGDHWSFSVPVENTDRVRLQAQLILPTSESPLVTMSWANLAFAR